MSLSLFGGVPIDHELLYKNNPQVHVLNKVQQDIGIIFTCHMITCMLDLHGTTTIFIRFELHSIMV